MLFVKAIAWAELKLRAAGVGIWGLLHPKDYLYKLMGTVIWFLVEEGG